MAGYPFPVKVAKFSRGLQHFYRSGLGFSVTYKMYGRPGETSAEIYIYDLGRDLTSADPVKASADQRDAALSDIQAEISAARDHIAARISKTDEGPFAKAHLTLTQMGKTWDEYIFVTVKNNRFVKIRVKSSSDNAARLADRFAAEYARLLSQ